MSVMHVQLLNKQLYGNFGISLDYHLNFLQVEGISNQMIPMRDVLVNQIVSCSNKLTSACMSKIF